MYRVIRSVLVFSLVTVLASCEYWNKDMLGYLEYWSSTVQMGRVEVTDVTIQKNDSGVDTISASSTPTITGYIINPQSYQLLAEIGDSSNTDKSIRISNPTVQVKAQLEGYDPTMLRIKLNPADSSLEHTDFRVDFEAIRQETMQSAGEVMGVTLRYNTPPIAPIPVTKNDDTGEYFTVSSGQIWKADRGGYVYWAYDDSITDEKDPNCAKWFTINGTRHLVADCKVPNVQVSGLSIFQFKTDYSNTTLAAVDVEGVSSSTLTSGQAVPPATYVIKYDANGATGGSVPASQNKPQYTDITLARNEGNLTRIGYRFLGWNTSPDGNGQDYAEGATYSDDAGVTLYAKWDVVNTVTFTPGSDTVDHGDSVIIYPPAGATIHYSTDEGVSWENGSQDQPVTITLYNETNVPQGTTGEYVGIPEGGEVTITAYAVHTDGSQSEETSETYSLNQYTVTYDGNGNSYGNIPSPKTFFSGKKVQLASQDNLRRSGYSFDGWNTADNGSGKTYAAGSEHVFTGDTNLYAKWNPMTEFFVSSSSTNNPSNDGSEEYPFGTVDKAVHYINEINNGTQSFIIHVEGTYTATEDDVKNDNTSVVNIAPDKTLTLTIQGKDGQTATINANNHGRVMYIGANAKVILQNITLTGGNFTTGGGVYIASDGSLTLKSGATISGNTGTSIGGGVYSDGTLTMETGSSIKNNTANDQGGGVFINNGAFNMTGGTISDNAADDGGGVYIATGGSLTLNNGATISGNTASSTVKTPMGGGVYNEGTFNMTGGTISGNTAKNDGASFYPHGGGVNNHSSGTFTMTGGTISGNEASFGGGVNNDGTFNMSGGTINGNTATNGCGVYNDGTFTMSGSSTVDANNDVYLPSGKTITVNSALTGSFPVATITPQTYTSSTQVLDGSRVDKEFVLFKVTEDSSDGKWGVAATGMLLQYTSAVDATDVLQNLVNRKSVSFDMTSDTEFTPHDTYPNIGDPSYGLKGYAIHVPKNTTLVINGNDKVLKEDGYCDNLLNVEGTLVLNDVRIAGTILHSSVIEVGYGAMVILNNCIIENNQGGGATTYGVINIESGGTAIMNGGKIEGNYLAGVTIYDGGEFTIKGGVIQNNQKGGVRCRSNATFVNNGGFVDKLEENLNRW